MLRPPPVEARPLCRHPRKPPPASAWVFVRPNLPVPSGTRDRFSFPTGPSGFRAESRTHHFSRSNAASADRRPLGARLVSSRSMSASKHRLIIFTIHPIPTLRVETTRAPGAPSARNLCSTKDQIHFQPQRGGIFGWARLLTSRAWRVKAQRRRLARTLAPPNLRKMPLLRHRNCTRSTRPFADVAFSIIIQRPLQTDPRNCPRATHIPPGSQSPNSSPGRTTGRLRPVPCPFLR